MPTCCRPACAEARLPAPPWARTWIENWPAALSALSFPQQSVPLTPAQAHALGRRNGVFASWFEGDGADDDSRLEELRAVLDARLHLLGGEAFARLGSRSAKDTPLGVLTGGRVDTGAAALRLLTDGSRRVGLDLRRAARHGLTPWIHLREWRTIPWWHEFRCFLAAGRLVGVSQYHARHPLPAEALDSIAGMRRAIEDLAGRIAEAWGGDAVVADVVAPPGGHATLIELNPWGEATDPALFSWEQQDFDGSLRVLDAGGYCLRKMK